MKINKELLNQKLETLARFPEIDRETVGRLGGLLSQSDEWELLRINPLHFAEVHGLPGGGILDLFVYAAKIGLFDFRWNLICPKCGCITRDTDTIANIEQDSYYCPLCDYNVETDLSNFIEVAFSVNPGIARLSINPFDNFDHYFRYFFSRNFITPQGFSEKLSRAFLDFRTLEPDQWVEIPFQMETGSPCRLLSLDSHTGLLIEPQTAPGPRGVGIDMTPSGFSPPSVSLPEGEAVLKLHNTTNRTAGVILARQNCPKLMEVFTGVPTRFAPFVTGKMLLNNQSFRDLFRVQSLPRDLRLKVSNVTVLFSDLKDSTELYDKTGDIYAYNLVQEHFNLLKHSTRLYDGAVIKTIGDAVMATFSTSGDGVSAAMDMMERIRGMNRLVAADGHQLSLKIGIHTGTALAVTANEILDYFGQTINLGARVQGLAGGGEICLTRDLHETPEIKKILSDNGYCIEEQSAQLKGLSQATTVYRCAPG